MWAGAATLALGLIIGFSPLSSHDVKCGSAYAPKDESFFGDDPAADCSGLRSVVQVPALVLSVSGVVVVAIGWIRHSSETGELEGHRTVLGRPVSRRDDDDE